MSLSLDLPALAKTAATYAVDLGERTVATAAEAFVSALVLSQPFDLAMWKGASIAGLAAGAAVLKGVVAKFRGDRKSASLAKGV